MVNIQSDKGEMGGYMAHVQTGTVEATPEATGIDQIRVDFGVPNPGSLCQAIQGLGQVSDGV